MELECDYDWKELERILSEAPKENEYITYKDVKYIKEEYCIPKQKIKDKIEKLKPIVKKYDEQMDKDEDTDLSYEEVREIARKIEVLQELLKENK